MALPDVTLTIRDGALGTALPSSQNIALKVGCAPLGVVNSIYSVSDLATLTSSLGKGGPLVEAAALSLSTAGGPLYCVPVNPSTYGTLTGVVKVGTGTPSMTVAAKPSSAIVFKVTVGGAVATARLAPSFDGGVTYQPDFLTAATVMVPGASLVTIALAGGSFTVGDTYSMATTGVVTQSGVGTGTVAVSTASPLDVYTAVVTIVAGGALGVGTFTYSLDGGNTTSAVILIPAGGAYVIPDSGVVLTFPSGTYVAGDTYSFSSTAPSYSTTDFNNAMTAILADSRTWFMLHVVGAPSSVANAATLATAVDTQLSTAAAAYRFARALVECPSDTDANTLSGFASYASSGGRVLLGAGYAYLVSPVNGRVVSRNAAWWVAARAAKVTPSTDVAKVSDGPVTGIPSLTPLGAKGLVRDEQATPGLDAGRFCTLRTIIGRQGFYITNGRSMAAGGSDYTYLVNGRVMDIAAAVGRNAALNFLNDSVRVDPVSGFINEKDARSMEAFIDGSLRAALTQPGYASDLSVTLNRAANILSTGTEPLTIRVVPLGYGRAITIDLGFTNPALAAK